MTDPLDLASTVTALGQTQLTLPGAGGIGLVESVRDGDLVRELAIMRVRPELRMKRVVGTSLEQVLASLRGGDPAATERWTLARRIRMLHQVCMAIAFAHRRGVLHRDLKPANVMLGDDGEIVVMDWGLAVPLPGAAGERLRAVLPGGIDTASAGTPLYMSPEQARGDDLDERSDVYALGILLYELASLARPYEGATGQEILGRVGKADVRPIRDAWSDATRALAAIIDCALQPERTARYANVGELAADLERFMDGGSPVAEHAPAVKQLARFYVSRDRRLSRLRIMDIDLIAASSTALGVALGVLFAERIGGWWWIALVLSALAAVPPIVTWTRATSEERRP